MYGGDRIKINQVNIGSLGYCQERSILRVPNLNILSVLSSGVYPINRLEVFDRAQRRQISVYKCIWAHMHLGIQWGTGTQGSVFWVMNSVGICPTPRDLTRIIASLRLKEIAGKISWRHCLPYSSVKISDYHTCYTQQGEQTGRERESEGGEREREGICTMIRFSLIREWFPLDPAWNCCNLCIFSYRQLSGKISIMLLFNPPQLDILSSD